VDEDFGILDQLTTLEPQAKRPV